MKGISLRKSIDAKCKQCIYDPQSGLGTWREQVAQCTVTLCPLWPNACPPRHTVVGLPELGRA